MMRWLSMRNVCGKNIFYLFPFEFTLKKKENSENFCGLAPQIATFTFGSYFLWTGEREVGLH